MTSSQDSGSGRHPARLAMVNARLLILILGVTGTLARRARLVPTFAAARARLPLPVVPAGAATLASPAQGLPGVRAQALHAAAPLARPGRAEGRARVRALYDGERDGSEVALRLGSREDTESELVSILSKGERQVALVRREVKTSLSDARLHRAVLYLLEDLELNYARPKNFDMSSLVGRWLLDYTNDLPKAIKEELRKTTQDDIVDIRVLLAIAADGTVSTQADIVMVHGTMKTVTLRTRQLQPIDGTPRFVVSEPAGSESFSMEVTYANEGLLVTRKNREENNRLEALFGLKVRLNSPSKTAVWRRLDPPLQKWSVTPAGLWGGDGDFEGRRTALWRFGLLLPMMRLSARAPFGEKPRLHHARDRKFVEEVEKEQPEAIVHSSVAAVAAVETPDEAQAVINMVKALDVLSGDIPRVLRKEPHWNIYAEDLELDLSAAGDDFLQLLGSVFPYPTLKFRGLEANKEVFQTMRRVSRQIVQWERIMVKPMLLNGEHGERQIQCLWLGRVVVKVAELQKLVRATAGSTTNNALLKHLQQRSLRREIMGMTFSGVSSFHFDKHGKIYRHKVAQMQLPGVSNLELTDSDAIAESGDGGAALQSKAEEAVKIEFAEHVGADFSKRDVTMYYLSVMLSEFLSKTPRWSLFSESLELELHPGGEVQNRILNLVVPFQKFNIKGLEANKEIWEHLHYFKENYVEHSSIDYDLKMGYDESENAVIECPWMVQLQMKGMNFFDWGLRAQGQDELLVKFLLLHFHHYTESDNSVVSVRAVSRFYLDEDGLIYRHVIHKTHLEIDGVSMQDAPEEQRASEEVQDFLRTEYKDDADERVINSGKAFHYLFEHMPKILVEEPRDSGIFVDDVELDLQHVSELPLRLLHSVTPIESMKVKGIASQQKLLAGLQKFAKDHFVWDWFEVGKPEDSKPGASLIKAFWSARVVLELGKFREWVGRMKDDMLRELLVRRTSGAGEVVIVAVDGVSKFLLNSQGKIYRHAVSNVDLEIIEGDTYLAPSANTTFWKFAKLWKAGADPFIVGEKIGFSSKVPDNQSVVADVLPSIAVPEVPDIAPETTSNRSLIIAAEAVPVPVVKPPAPSELAAPSAEATLERLRADLPFILRDEPHWSLFSEDLVLEMGSVEEPCYRFLDAIAFLPKTSRRVEGMPANQEVLKRLQRFADKLIQWNWIEADTHLTRSASGEAVIECRWDARLKIKPIPVSAWAEKLRLPQFPAEIFPKNWQWIEFQGVFLFYLNSENKISKLVLDKAHINTDAEPDLL